MGGSHHFEETGMFNQIRWQNGPAYDRRGAEQDELTAWIFYTLPNEIFFIEPLALVSVNSRAE